MDSIKSGWYNLAWSPVSGCYSDCPNCQAKTDAIRFGYNLDRKQPEYLNDLSEPEKIQTQNGEIKDAPFPFKFNPTIYRYRLNQPLIKKVPHTILVCGMGDLFGSWIPDEWINAVMQACLIAPQHRYLFLTKNFRRFEDLLDKKIIPPNKPNLFFGHIISTQEDAESYFDWHIIRDENAYSRIKRFAYIELINEKLDFVSKNFPYDWVIVGDTGRKENLSRKRERIKHVLKQTVSPHVPVFMTENIKNIWTHRLFQQFPWKEKSLEATN
jgi:protein gp37